ncbi:pseudouridylate synthase [Fictibacillus macauensis ZFHKF-1]|uniref:Pseudouridine synthase n=1 Tax=Fictibacillus macauensis ZFHKF-1 TaxID=1196324 RepID=I8UCG0_9BACL|nr:RluA family pseudouridine synthase [Fictibacillus macauensis]EIT84610.1 pseudouridylate synthase [Fictibacillus macauensis ZFHKF-1]
MAKFVLRWIVEPSQTGLLRDFLRNKQLSKKAVTDIKFSGGKLLVNHQEVTVRKKLSAGDAVEVHFPKEPISEQMIPISMALDILYEDEHLLVVNKEAGLPTIPSRYQKHGSLAQGVLAYYIERGVDATFHGINRLDKDTSGLVMIAKHRFAHSLFSKQQKEKQIKRAYIAIAHGRFVTKKGTIDAPIGRKEDSLIERMVRADGQRAVTHYEVLQENEVRNDSVVKLRLETGRTHQIRVHMAHRHNPLLGDDLYGGRCDHIPRQALHSYEVTFVHPFTAETMTLAAPLPSDMKQLLHETMLE